MVVKTKHALIALFSALALCLGVTLVFAGDAAAANLLANPGFEAGNLSGWTCSGSASVVTSPVHSGSRAVTATPAGQDNAQCTQVVQVKPSTAYKLSAWVQGSYVYLGASGTGTPDVNTWTPAATGWSQLSVNFTTGAATSSVTIYLHGWYGQPAFFADDVNLDGPGTPPTTTPTTPTTPTTTPTTPTTTTTTPPNTGSLPKHVLTGYWQNFYNGAKALKLADVPTSYNIIAVSFADADASRPGAVTFTLDAGLSSQLGGYTDAQFKADIKTVQARGQKVIISVGGQNGTISVSDSTSSANFANSVKTLIQQYGFDGVDIDLENGINATYMGSALRSINAGGGSVITMAPQTIDMQSTSGGYFQLALTIKDILTIVNMQYYNSGSMNACNGQVYSQGTVDFLTGLACIQLQGGLRADQVGLGLPASSQAAGGGYQSPSNVVAGLNCLAKGTSCGSYKPAATYPAIRGAMTWSINWDATNGYGFANTVSAGLTTLP
ncbi:chitinase [Amycolatopsis sp. H20-H5]|uniref:chitinase n=1 Tax=Amycolatopsis sp. H20-H5 TaxID=3046309 RepID=UPI002DB5C17C|nr:glycosyl hydrolase family 18 protein [Amycolatopsis sp. H20-H5]MEC3977606.1 glycosyl hydrolase family 18 protein [Amycolatopsis sp. H20-H5]